MTQPAQIGSGEDILPADNRIEPQPDVRPDENDIYPATHPTPYPTTKFAPIDFAMMGASSETRLASKPSVKPRMENQHDRH